MTNLGIVIVNWNTREYLRRCLDSVLASVGASAFDVYVVDNASTDGSAQVVQTEYPQVNLIVNDTNAGYPGANNIGLRALGFGVEGAQAPQYALLLNPDTILPPDALTDMIAFMDAHADAGAAGPRLYLEDGSLDLACRRSFPSPAVSFYKMLGLARLFPNSPRFARYNLTFMDEYATTEVDSVVGAFMMVRGAAIAQVGLLDESFFMYGEDLDWAKRMKEQGWKIYYHPDVEVLHIKRAASRQSKRAQVEFYRAMLIFYRKHYRASASWYAHLAILAGILLKGGWQMLPEIVGRSPSLDTVKTN